MGWDYKRKEERTIELQESIKKLLVEAGVSEDAKEQTAKELLDSCIHITPPEEKELLLEMVTMHPSGRGGGRSTKAGNITLNVRKLFEAVSSGVFTVVSVTQMPWAIPFAFVLLWNSLWRNLEVPLSEHEAVVLWVMWQVKNREKIVNTDDIKPALDKHAKKYERDSLSNKDISFAIEKLKQIGCIKESKEGKKLWWLCEWISPSYR